MAKTIHRSEYEVLLRRLRELRLESGVTQESLSSQLGRSQSFVSDIERGVRRLDAIELRDICALLGSDLLVFLAGLEAEIGPVQVRRKPTRKTVKH